MTAHLITYDLHRMRCGRLSLARSDTASAAATTQTRMRGIKQPREDLLSVIALKIMEAYRWNTPPIRKEKIFRKGLDDSRE